MKRIFLSICIACLLCTSSIFAQEEVNASDLMGKISTGLNFDFKQEDAIRPIVQKYATSINKVQSLQSSDEKYIHLQLKALNQQLDKAISQMLSLEQLNTWKTLKKQILLKVPKDK
ncbi:MAG: hypothetical protein WCH62_01225 [Candidatus Omnitrophota bacterium]